MKNREDLQRSFQQRVNLYFDNELNREDSEQLIQEINQNPVQHKIFEKERSVRDFIKNNIKRPTVSPDLIQNIRDKINIR